MRYDRSFLGFAQFFAASVPPSLFMMSESPVPCRTLNNPEYGGAMGGDLVCWMRMFLQDSDPEADYINPNEAFGLDAEHYYDLVLGRGFSHLGASRYKMDLKRFDRFPPVSRRDIALDVLIAFLTRYEIPWFSCIQNRLGHNAALAVTEWCGPALG